MTRTRRLIPVRALAGLFACALAGCATTAPGPMAIVKPAAFPIEVQPQVASTDGSVFPTTASGSLYEPRRDWRPGDLVTINIVTSTTAANTDDDFALAQGHDQ